jgi:hypothetical protein
MMSEELLVKPTIRDYIMPKICKDNLYNHEDVEATLIKVVDVN